MSTPTPLSPHCCSTHGGGPGRTAAPTLGTPWRGAVQPAPGPLPDQQQHHHHHRLPHPHQAQCEQGRTVPRVPQVRVCRLQCHDRSYHAVRRPAGGQGRDWERKVWVGTLSVRLLLWRHRHHHHDGHGAPYWVPAVPSTGALTGNPVQGDQRHLSPSRTRVRRQGGPRSLHWPLTAHGQEVGTLRAPALCRDPQLCLSSDAERQLCLLPPTQSWSSPLVPRYAPQHQRSPVPRAGTTGWKPEQRCDPALALHLAPAAADAHDACPGDGRHMHRLRQRQRRAKRRHSWHPRQWAGAVKWSRGMALPLP